MLFLHQLHRSFSSVIKKSSYNLGFNPVFATCWAKARFFLTISITVQLIKILKVINTKLADYLFWFRLFCGKF